MIIYRRILGKEGRETTLHREHEGPHWHYHEKFERNDSDVAFSTLDWAPMIIYSRILGKSGRVTKLLKEHEGPDRGEEQYWHYHEKFEWYDADVALCTCDWALMIIYRRILGEEGYLKTSLRREHEDPDRGSLREQCGAFTRGSKSLMR